MLKIKRRKIMVRARDLTQAKLFGNTTYRKRATFEYLPEKLVSVKLSKRAGLAGGIKGYIVEYRQLPDTRPRKKSGVLYKSYQGRKPRL